MIATAEDDHLTGLCVEERTPSNAGEQVEYSSLPIFNELHRQLELYWDRKLQVFEIPLAPHGTSFQLRVWSALQGIPYGETISYGELARRIGQPAAVRAVGGANGANPIAIIIPCHRVISWNGALSGYAGGADRKRALLALEDALTPRMQVEGARGAGIGQL
jgi:methylated-DNA-[protein]-cysteine S-methyltransferase